jgi:hypothetical protein
MKKTSIAIIIVLLLFTLPFVYWRLGGFNPIQVSIQDQSDMKLLGLIYRGTPQDPGMLGTFQRIEELTNRYPQSRLHTLYDIEPAGKLDTLEVFVGVEFLEEINEQEELTVREIRCSQIIVAEIEAHRLVMPSPEKVKSQIESFAASRNISTQGLYVDKLIDDRRVEVIAPVR